MRDKIETNRLRLRPLRFSDAPEIARYTSDPRVARMLDNVPCPHPVAAVEGWLLINAARAPLGEEFFYGIEFAGNFVGALSLTRRGGPANRAWSLGYWIGRPFWGQGIATEAACAAVAEARMLGPLIASHYVDNPASGRVLEKAGFIYTGITAPRFCLSRGATVEARQMRLEARRMAA